jgi:PAS domain-containing protein
MNGSGAGRDAVPYERHAEFNLAAFAEQAGILSAAATTGLIITDADGAIISFNKAAQDLLGVSIDEYKDNGCISSLRRSQRSPKAS